MARVLSTLERGPHVFEVAVTDSKEICAWELEQIQLHPTQLLQTALGQSRTGDCCLLYNCQNKISLSTLQASQHLSFEQFCFLLHQICQIVRPLLDLPFDARQFSILAERIFFDMPAGLNIQKKKTRWLLLSQPLVTYIPLIPKYQSEEGELALSVACGRGLLANLIETWLAQAPQNEHEIQRRCKLLNLAYSHLDELDAFLQEVSEKHQGLCSPSKSNDAYPSAKQRQDHQFPRPAKASPPERKKQAMAASSSNSASFFLKKITQSRLTLIFFLIQALVLALCYHLLQIHQQQHDWWSAGLALLCTSLMLIVNLVLFLHPKWRPIFRESTLETRLRRLQERQLKREDLLLLNRAKQEALSTHSFSTASEPAPFACLFRLEADECESRLIQALRQGHLAFEQQFLKQHLPLAVLTLETVYLGTDKREADILLPFNDLEGIRLCFHANNDSHYQLRDLGGQDPIFLDEKALVAGQSYSLGSCHLLQIQNSPLLYLEPQAAWHSDNF